MLQPGRSLPALVLILVASGSMVCGAPDTLVKELNEENWRDLLTGEWMVEFYAPWCPACNALQTAWRELSLRADSKLGVKTAAVDVTTSPGLSGRFVVTALPTIYHVKGAEFRQYKGPRDTDSMMSWLGEGRWRQTEAVSSWKAPDSLQMTLVAHFFKLSQALRGVHTMLMETYGLPTWGSYLIFALATIFMGALLGLVLVCIIDFLYPPKRHPGTVYVSKAEAAGASPPEQELINEDLVDEERDSDAERNSGSDTQSSDNEENSASQKTSSEEAAGAPEASGDAAADVRKRRPRKAD